MQEETQFASIIIDNGSETVKIGHAGDEAPRHVIQTLIGYSRQPELEIILDQKDYKIGQKAFKKRGFLDMEYPIQNRKIQNFDSMEKIWHHCLFETLQVNPMQYSVLLTESCEYTPEDRIQCAEIFFEYFNSPSLYMGNQGMLGLFSTGSSKGVVVDSGEGGTHIIPIYEGYISPYSLNKTKISGQDITNYLHKLLMEKGVTFSRHFDYDIIKDIKETKCYISLDYKEELKLFEQNANTKDLLYELPDNQKINLNKEQIQTPEILFKPQMIGRDEIGIGELIYKCYFSIDTEIRKSLFENILLVGGNTLFPNIAERIYKNIQSIGGNSINFKISCPSERKYSSWIGGSILSCLTPFENMWVTKQEYEEYGGNIMNSKKFQQILQQNLIINFLVVLIKLLFMHQHLSKQNLVKYHRYQHQQILILFIILIFLTYLFFFYHENKNKQVLSQPQQKQSQEIYYQYLIFLFLQKNQQYHIFYHKIFFLYQQ